MAKSHVIILEIENNTGETMYYASDWFDSGRIADNYSVPDFIPPKKTVAIQLYERDSSGAGCSGYLTFIMSNTLYTIAFSNPVSGTNKLGVGLNGKKVWDDMTNHNYGTFIIDSQLFDSTIIEANCLCTGGETNKATVFLKRK